MQRRKETQDTYDLYGRYVEVGPGEGCLIFSHRHKGDNSLDISVWRKTNPRSDMKSCHIFNGAWEKGVFHAYNIMDRQSNEYKFQEKMLKELVMGTESSQNYLTLIVAEHKILDYDAMKAINLSPGEWEHSAPDDQSSMELYSKYKFMKDGSVNFQLRKPDHTVIETIIFRREDRTNRQNRGTVRSTETNHLFSLYKEGLETALALDDGNDDMLAAAAIEAETRNDGDNEAFDDGDDENLAAAKAETGSDGYDEDEDFNDGDDVNLAAVGIQAEIQNDFGLGAPDDSYEVSSIGDRASRVDLDKNVAEEFK